MELSAFFLRMPVKISSICLGSHAVWALGKTEKVECGNQIDSVNGGELFDHL